MKTTWIAALILHGCVNRQIGVKRDDNRDTGQSDTASDDTGSDCTPGDRDCDGYVDDDCDDTDPDVHPGGSEGDADGDGKDNDCDGIVDEGTLDYDDDGDGWTENEGDCDDADATRSPSAEDIVGDGYDANCDGTDADPNDVHSMGENLATLVGSETRLTAGWSVVNAGDLDGDDVVDIAIGAPDEADTTGSKEGKVFVVNGPLAGGVSLADATATYEYGRWNDGTGEDIAGGGDIDGDGFDDLALGSDNFADPDEDYWGMGRVAVYFGPVVGALDPAYADALITGSYDLCHLSRGLGALSDLDEDGYADLLLGSLTESTSEETQQGVVLVFRGPIEGQLSDADAEVKLIGDDHSLGQTMSIAGDLNGDGVGDLVLGADGDAAPSEPGALWLVDGPIGESGYVADLGWSVPGTHGGAEFGSRVTALGDTDGDGLDDIGVAAHLDSEAGTRAGAAYVFLGPVTAEFSDEANMHIIGEGEHDWLGYGLSSAGDFNGDGAPDLAVSAPGDLYSSPDGPGLVYVFTSLTTGTIVASSADAVFTGEDWWSWAGASIASAVDQNSDGFDDLVIGAPYDSEGGDYAGKVYIVGGFAD